MKRKYIHLGKLLDIYFSSNSILLMSQARFQIIYDGDALQNHQMDVRDIAPALLSLGSLFDEANRVVNDNKLKLQLNIKALSAGSFMIDLELIQTLVAQIQDFLSGDSVVAALNLYDILFGGVGLFFIIKKLRGGKPDKIEKLDDNFVILEVNGEKYTIPINLLKLYKDVAVRKAVEEILKPLQKDGIDALKIAQDGETKTSVDKNEAQFYKLPALEDEIITESEYEAAYSIVSLTFKEDNKWRLSDGNATINVTIKDERFLQEIEQKLISFTKGDFLICKVRTVQTNTDQGLKTEHEVLEVKEHKKAARQLDLGF